MDPKPKVPTLADLEALPPGVKGEIIDGVLYTMTRQRGPHQHTGLEIAADLRDPRKAAIGQHDDCCVRCLANDFDLERLQGFPHG